jgi:phosphoribosylamine---glycine ligase
MKVLIVGSGGREHALAWKVVQSHLVTQVFVAPGNAGTTLESKVQNIPLSVDQISELVNFAQTNAIDLTIIGPEAPLAAGIVDRFQAVGLRCFGPSAEAAQLESSKVFCKNFLKRHHIPTAFYETFTDLAKATAFIEQQSLPIVIKASGLASGKGVIIAHTKEEAIETIENMLSGHSFGAAAAEIVIEQFLEGEEISFIAMVDGNHILPLATSQDHKTRDNGDVGPNTGGMGAYSPAPLVTPALQEAIMAQVMRPTVEGMKAEKIPFTGFLYAGLMIKNGQINVLEFNCRFGDPETQPILMRMQSDLVPLCLQALEGTLDKATITWDPRFAVGVVLASEGYPGTYTKGKKIDGLANPLPSHCKIFHSGTKLLKDDVVTDGGRVLCITGLGDTLLEAQKQAYDAIQQVHFEGVFYRHDIGHRGL